jgi:hypothetical protein
MIPQARSASNAGATERSLYLTPPEVATGRRRRGPDHPSSGEARGGAGAKERGASAGGRQGGTRPIRGRPVTSVMGMSIDTLSLGCHIL